VAAFLTKAFDEKDLLTAIRAAMNGSGLAGDGMPVIGILLQDNGFALPV
jgi:hypothetical protein